MLLLQCFVVVVWFGDIYFFQGKRCSKKSETIFLHVSRAESHDFFTINSPSTSMWRTARLWETRTFNIKHEGSISGGFERLKTQEQNLKIQKL